MRNYLFVLCILCSVVEAAEVACLEALNSPRANTRRRLGSMKPFYSFSMGTDEPMFDRKGVLRLTSYFRERGRQSLFRVDRLEFKKINKEEEKSLPVVASDQEEFNFFLMEFMNFVIAQYKDRRPSWSEEYLALIREDARLFAERTLFFVARRLQNYADEKGKIAGVLKIIKGDHQNSLPLEEEHKIRLPLNGGRKFEPGNFAVLKSERDWAFSELIIQLMNFSRLLVEDPEHVPGAQIFFTDADEVSTEMYRRLGFKEVTQFPETIETSHGKVQILGASAEDILNLKESLKARRQEWSDDSEYGYAHLAQILDEYDIGQPEWSGVSFSKLAIFSQKKLPKSSPPLTVHVSALITEPKVQSEGFYLMFDRQGLGGMQSGYFIPKNYLHRLSWTYQPKSNLSLVYSNSILEIVEQTAGDHFIIRMKIDPNFQGIQSVQYQHFKGEALWREIKTVP